MHINKTVNPLGNKKDHYDAVIIGAGIGGLVCGCYLAKAGMKVLILEKNIKPGGYCTSFKIDGFVFDMLSLQSCGKNDEFGKIIYELGIDRDVTIKRMDLSIAIIAPDYKIKIFSEAEKTIDNLSSIFPEHAKEIGKFFYFIENVSWYKLCNEGRKISFRDFLMNFFKKNNGLMSMFELLMSQIGVPISELSVISAVTYIRNLILSGGYYVENGVQNLADAFALKFKKLGGELMCAACADGIEIKGGQVEGVKYSRGKFVSSKYVISNCDASNTFLKLIDTNLAGEMLTKKIKNMKVSNSAFMMLCLLKKECLVDDCQQFWCCLNSYDDYRDMKRLTNSNFLGHIYCNRYAHQNINQPLYDGISIGTYVPYIDTSYWSDGQRKSLEKKLLDRIETIIPCFRKNILKKIVLTPTFFEKFTGNKEGALRGFAPYCDQIGEEIISIKTKFRNLFLSSHWVVMPFGESGLPMTAFVGKSAAKIIFKRFAQNEGKR